MGVQLRQGGRAAMDFMVGMVGASRPLAARWGAALAKSGVTADTLPDDIDARHRVMNEALAGSDAFAVNNLVIEFASVEHGRVARDGFDEMADVLLPRLAQLEAKGPATLTIPNDFVEPDYYKGVWFHRTTGGWNGHPEMGFIHSELVHKTYVARMFGGDIFAQRRAVLGLLPRSDYTRILEMGTSSAHFTTALQETFPAAHITGVELALPMLKEALRVANANGWDWDLHQRAAEDTGFEGDRFDLVASYIILHEMPASAIRAAFAEAFRLLEPGGQMLMSDVTPYRMLDKLGAWRADASAKKGGEPYWREAATLDWSATAREVGFVDVNEGGLNGAPYPWVITATKPGKAAA
ncbi:MAG: class I SAM-dependent methyltransferase [Sandarakinorhabdus sp.]|nr:class I SAM-dependent methyltransferase [Sandarakinorhabdus sp.]